MTSKGITGISTLILFIALILVTAIAATVLMQSAESLRAQSAQTSKESKEKLLTKLNISSVTGELNNEKTAITYLRISAITSKSSEKLVLKDITISIQTDSNYFKGIDYNKAIGNSEQNMRDSVNDFNVFTIRYLEKISLNKKHIEPTERVEIWYNLNGLVGKNEKINIVITPAIGYETRININTPRVFDKTTVNLY